MSEPVVIHVYGTCRLDVSKCETIVVHGHSAFDPRTTYRASLKDIEERAKRGAMAGLLKTPPVDDRWPK